MKILSAVMVLLLVFLIGAKVGKETTPNYHNSVGEVEYCENQTK